MVVNNFDIVRIAATPLETNTPLAIDADAVLPLPIAFKRFQFVPGWNLQILQPHGSVQHAQLR